MADRACGGERFDHVRDRPDVAHAAAPTTLATALSSAACATTALATAALATAALAAAALAAAALAAAAPSASSITLANGAVTAVTSREKSAHL